MPRSTFPDSSEHRQALSDALRRARFDADLTQAEMARRMSVSVAFYSRMERGVALPNVATLAQIARVLRISADVLIGTDARSRSAGPSAPAPVVAEAPAHEATETTATDQAADPATDQAMASATARAPTQTPTHNPIGELLAAPTRRLAAK